MAAASNKTSFRRGVSNIGRNAAFASADEEIARILAHKQNYYVCLKVLKDSDPADIRANYLRLSRLVHPDKCPDNPNAPEASSILNLAKDTLTNPLKKRLYDAYVTDVTTGGADTTEMSYADWEAAQAQYPVKVPAWLESILRIPVVGQVFAILLLLLLIPLLLVVVLIGLALWLICLPINICCRCLCGPPMTPEQFAAFQQARQQGGTQPTTAPTQQPTATREANPLSSDAV